MGRVLIHRGPDSSGHWSDAGAGIALAHRRLAIQDLTAAGHQPMSSVCGRFVICYNGEIYNAPDLQRDLRAAGLRLRGHSDTEALVEGVARWGLERILERLVGMFAFALWDRAERELTLARDRFGIKPLFWHHGGGRLLFGSEIKALLAVMETPPPLSRDGLASYLDRGFIPAPLTIHRGIRKLRPGGLLRIRAGGEPRETTYWTLTAMLGKALSAPRITDPVAARELIEARLGDAVRIRMLSDRPIGALLSGGIDSALIAALMQAGADTPVNTYSIGSPERGYDEAAHARRIAAHLGTRHTELTLSEADCMAVIPHLARIYDEPLGDSSQVPAVVVSRLAREHVTVALSGDGGDEVFCGYNRYLWNARLAVARRVLPRGLRHLLAAGLRGAAPGLLNLIGRAAGEAGAARRTHKLAAMLGEDDATERYRRVVTQWPGLSRDRSATALWAAVDWDEVAGLSEEERFQVLDLLSFVPDDILTKVDRASMAYGLEVRVPFLDHRVVEAAFTLDPALKLRRGTTKWILRRMLADRVPEHLFERPKQGFAIPIEKWLRHELRGWAAALICDTDWEGRFGLPRRPIEAAWQAHARGRSDQSDRLWSILMLASWAEGAGHACVADGRDPRSDSQMALH
jgi:asparagine synthase (glutamine-hydrolysing)